MNIYLLKREAEYALDEAYGFVVIAKDEKRAREIIASPVRPHAYKDEGAEPWLDEKQSTCEIIGKALSNKTEGIVLSEVTGF